MVADVYKLLRVDVKGKFKKETLYGKDCQVLSKQIYNETRRQLSATTLKRFFGLIESTFKPSKYTLDSLAIYVGFKDWHDYLNAFDESRYTTSKYDTWDLLKIRMMPITEHCLESLKQKTNYNPQKFIHREFAEERFDKFITSGARATIFVAPDGYGKSTQMIQLTEKILTNNSGEFKNDIVCLIDGGIFFNLYAQNNNIKLLNQLINFDIQSSISLYFQQKPEDRKGKIWFFIDSIDEIFFDVDRYQQLVENLMRILMAHNNNWFKVILTCRPENLEVFAQAIHKNPLLKSFWYDVKFFEDPCFNAINIPLYSHSEIKSVLKLHHAEQNYKDIFSQHSDILGIINYPFSLSLFIGSFRQNENISDIILLNRFINTKILTPPFLKEKLMLINQYVKLCNFGRDTNSVKKDSLLPDGTNKPAYRELISNGILYEYIIPEDSIYPTIYISFKQEVIFEYFVLRAWTEGNPMTEELFFTITKFYNCRKYTQCNLVKLSIKMLVHEENFELINSIHQSFENLLSSDTKFLDARDCRNVIRSTLIRMIEKHEELGKKLNVI